MGLWKEFYSNSDSNVATIFPWESQNFSCLSFLICKTEINPNQWALSWVPCTYNSFKIFWCQKKRHRCIEQTFGLYGRRWGWNIWENSIETCILSSVKQSASPGWMHKTSAQGWCTGMTQRDGMGREVGGGFRMGNTCKSMADSCQSMSKTTTIL